MVMKDMSFGDFCDKMCANTMDICVTTDSILILVPGILKIANVVINDLEGKVSRFDSLKVSYVQRFFEQYDDNLEDVIHDKTGDDDIPDELMNYLAGNLYQMKYNDMTKHQKNIINVLAIYIILQI
jgi:hypothetical protein